MRVLPLLAAFCVVTCAYAQEPSAPPPPASEAAQSPAAPKTTPLVEYDSGVRLLFGSPWARTGKDGTVWAINGAIDQGQLVVRFPFAIEPKAASLDELHDRELGALQKDRSWRRESKQLAPDALALATPPEFQTRQLSIASRVNDAAWLKRTVYVRTPEGKLMAIDCSLPSGSVAANDACAGVVGSIAMLPDQQLQLGRDRQRATEMETPCSVVSQEIERFRAAYPDKPISDMYRFAITRGLVTTMAMDNERANAAGMVALSKAMPDVMAAIEAACRETPSLKYSEAITQGLERGLPRNTPK